MKANKPFKKAIKSRKRSGSDSSAYRRKKLFVRKLKSKEKRKLRNRLNSFYKSYLNKGNKEKRKKSAHYKARKKYDPSIELFCNSNPNKIYSQYSGSITLANDFCLHENPENVLTTLLRILNNGRQKNYTKVQYTGDVSFGALYLLDSLCWEIASKYPKWKLDAKNISPRNYEIQSNLKSFKTGNKDTLDTYIYNNKIKINREDDKLAKQRHKEASKTVRELINKGIEDIIETSHQLEYNEIAAIESAITEHFDNILLHVPQASHGYLCTFFDRSKKTITILIFNYGHTIASSLEGNKVPQNVQNDIDQVVNNYTEKGFFNLGSHFTRENALTLLALQEGISSKLGVDESRGHGIIDYIKHCKKMSNETKITIISGKTAIKIDQNSDISTQNVFGRPRKIIALNKGNDIMQKPNSNYVKDMKVAFPGVIIETVIPININ